LGSITHHNNRVSVVLHGTIIIIKYANQTSDILRYPMDNKFIMYCAIIKPGGT